MNHAQHGRQLFAWHRVQGAQAGGIAGQIMATHASTSFNFATRFLPPEQRRCATDLYAFFRTLDDLVDESTDAIPTSVVQAELNDWRAWLDSPRTGSAPREPLGADLARVIESCQIRVEVFQHMLDGMEADLNPRELATEAELHTYCYQVASTVGYAMAHVLGAPNPAALAAAEQLGVAMQLTNILRDVGEDLAAGRVYLPKSTLARYGLCRTELDRMRLISGPDERFCALMCAEIARADRLYDAALPGIWLLPNDCRLPILIASRLYRHLLRRIEANGYDSLRQRAATTRTDKLREATFCSLLAWRGRDRLVDGMRSDLSVASFSGTMLDMQGD